MVENDDWRYEGPLQIEEKDGSLYLVCPTCLASIKKPSSWHPAADGKGCSKHDHKEPKSLESRLQAICTRFASLAFLMLFLACFSVGGAAMFRAIEGPNEETVVIQLNIAKAALMNKAYDLAHELEYEEYVAAVNSSLEYYDRMSGYALKHGITSGQVEARWSFNSALFYCVTIFTTIGYGNVCPTTSLGRITTVIYGLVAIPLFMVIIGKVGRYLATGLNLWFVCYNKLVAFCCFSTPGEGEEEREPLVSRSWGSAMSIQSGTDVQLKASPAVAILVAMAFMVAGTVMYMLWEPWTFLEAFYFVFISLSTIGFGDFVPTQPTFFMLSSMYLFIGLALISMVINVLINFYTSAYARAHDTVAQSKFCTICRK